uniref:Uncharacterized protein n=1 Tax=Noctiluca scintillans TaxID=2966 RepID=A0A7S0ZNI6_NOCSC
MAVSFASTYVGESNAPTREVELFEHVGFLLESMSRAGEDVNLLERHLDSKKQDLELCRVALQRLQETLDIRSGGALVASMPFYNAEKELSAAKARREALDERLRTVREQLAAAKAELSAVEALVGFGAHDVCLDVATSRALWVATDRKVSLQRQLELCETGCANSSRDVQKAQSCLLSAEEGAGAAAIKRAKPFLIKLHAAQSEECNINVELEELIRRSTSAKAHHKASMDALAEINASMHESRKGVQVDSRRTKSFVDAVLYSDWRPLVDGDDHTSTFSQVSSSYVVKQERKQPGMAAMRRRFALAKQRRRDRAFDKAVLQFRQGLFTVTPPCGSQRNLRNTSSWCSPRKPATELSTNLRISDRSASVSLCAARPEGAVLKEADC